MSGLIDFAFDYCMGEEGNALYTNDPRDPGGPTKYGIALNANRATIPDKDGNGIINTEDVKLLSREDAKDLHAEVLEAEPRRRAAARHRVLLRRLLFQPRFRRSLASVAKALYALGMGIAVDGKVGPKTLAAARVVDPAKLLPELAAQRQMYYASRIAGMGIPFYVMHYHKDESSVWGDGMVWLLRDLQSAVNAAIRMALDNAAISSIPQIALNYGALSANTSLDVYPGKVWAFDDSQDMREAMMVWTLPTSSNQILQIYTLLSQIMDEVSVPRYLSGDNSGVTGAGDTASGLSMLMNAANLTIQDLVRNFDDGVTSPFIAAMYSWNMVLNPDPAVKGDFDVVATGSSSLLVKEAESQKMLQIFQITNSPRFLGRVKDDLFISELFKMFNLPDKILRTETEFQQHQLQEMQQQALAQAQAQVTASVTVGNSLNRETLQQRSLLKSLLPCPSLGTDSLPTLRNSRLTWLPRRHLSKMTRHSRSIQTPSRRAILSIFRVGLRFLLDALFLRCPCRKAQVRSAWGWILSGVGLLRLRQSSLLR